ncbi:MAG: neutral/alkaline non-lysosomal ceramidase N-terminal domain-containing protein [Bryobacterales bacterium]|nr:neutral/alkaline non-lysosomal ceramidase N-terminal domain-containing protein [Bryobacterales bacterium]
MSRIMVSMLFVLAMMPLAQARQVRVGVAKVEITPPGPIWLSGYAARTKPSEGVAHKLFAKALAIEDGGRGRLIVVTTDLIGLPRSVTEPVSASLAKQYGLDRSRLLFNSSHTHAGPVVTPNLMTMYFLTEEQKRAVNVYRDQLVEHLNTVVGAALRDLAPAKLSIAHGTVGFSHNRRTKGGPVDQDVPTIVAHTSDGKLKAVLFGYACHNTTLGGDYYQVSGDYAGYAQTELERLQPGVTALFLLLCGGDQNPNPRGAVAHAEEYGKALASEVNRVLPAAKPLALDLRTAFQITELAFAPHTREQFESESKDENKFKASRAREMLRAYDERRPIRRTPYPVQAVRFAKGVALLALGGEVVVDYSLRAKKEYADTDLIVAGYSNDVMCYIPSLRVLREGGYEGETSMIYYGQPGKFSEEVEETVFRSVRQVLSQVGVKSK